MPGIGANYVNLPSATDDFTVLTNSFDAGADFHPKMLSKEVLLKPTSIRGLGGYSQGPFFGDLGIFSIALLANVSPSKTGILDLSTVGKWHN